MRLPATVATMWCSLGVACTSDERSDGTLDVGEARINYTVAGSGPAVVLIHGWALSLREWDDQIASLAPHFRVVAYDRRGYGKSTGFADPSADPGDLQTLLDTLKIRSAVLVGHSAGADIATRFAAAIPKRVNGLVLYGGAPPEGFPIPSKGPGFEFVKTFARQHGVDSLFRLVEGLPHFRPGPNRTAEMQARLDSILAGYTGRDILQDHPQSGAFPPARFAAVRQWRFPTLFISGAAEEPYWHLASDSLVRWMPNARKVVVPGGGHGVHFDEPARFNAALLAFLREIH
ncbi:MAG TPA: alpha/beta hydrolase [Gemmatimonadales bacterium]|nr:alpha/beta hydrolase [Gemmatimonadales bacterium]